MTGVWVMNSPEVTLRPRERQGVRDELNNKARPFDDEMKDAKDGIEKRKLKERYTQRTLGCIAQHSPVVYALTKGER